MRVRRRSQGIFEVDITENYTLGRERIGITRYSSKVDDIREGAEKGHHYYHWLHEPRVVFRPGQIPEIEGMERYQGPPYYDVWPGSTAYIVALAAAAVRRVAPLFRMRSNRTKRVMDVSLTDLLQALAEPDDNVPVLDTADVA